MGLAAVDAVAHGVAGDRPRSSGRTTSCSTGASWPGSSPSGPATAPSWSGSGSTSGGRRTERPRSATDIRPARRARCPARGLRRARPPTSTRTIGTALGDARSNGSASSCPSGEIVGTAIDVEARRPAGRDRRVRDHPSAVESATSSTCGRPDATMRRDTAALPFARRDPRTTSPTSIVAAHGVAPGSPLPWMLVDRGRGRCGRGGRRDPGRRRTHPGRRTDRRTRRSVLADRSRRRRLVDRVPGRELPAGRLGRPRGRRPELRRLRRDR